MNCPICKKEIERKDKKCTYCGWTPESKNSGIKIVGIVLMVVAVAMVAVVGTMLLKDNGKTQQTDVINPVTAEQFLGITIGEIKGIYGKDMDNSGAMSGYVPAFEGHDALFYYEDDRVPFDFFVKDIAVDGVVANAVNTPVYEVVFYNNQGKEPVAITDDIMSDIAFSEIFELCGSRLFSDTVEGTYFTACTTDKGICVFEFDSLPGDDSVATAIKMSLNTYYTERFSKLQPEEVMAITGTLVLEENDVVSVADDTRTFVMLNLDEPFETEVWYMKREEISQEYIEIDSIQLGLYNESYEQYIGKRVRVTGTVHTWEKPGVDAFRNVLISDSKVEILDE